MESTLSEMDFGVHTLRYKVAGIIVECTSRCKVAWIRNADIERRTGCVGAAEAINEEWVWGMGFIPAYCFTTGKRVSRGLQGRLSEVKRLVVIS